VTRQSSNIIDFKEETMPRKPKLYFSGIKRALTLPVILNGKDSNKPTPAPPTKAATLQTFTQPTLANRHFTYHLIRHICDMNCDEYWGERAYYAYM
jgi:hypothetical protein